MVYFKNATTISLVAALIIEAYIVAAILYGLDIIYTPIGVTGGLILLVLAILAYYSYINSVRYSRRAMLYIAPLGIIIGVLALAIVTGVFSSEISPLRLLFIAYVIEVIVGWFLRVDYSIYSRVASWIFYLGVIIFTISLALIDHISTALYATFLGNSIKIIGLIKLYRSI
ncbi:MAG: hypothetical protein QXG64_05020 [Acidilobaceae archaeon]